MNNDKEQIEREIKILEDNFDLTEEEIDGFLEFFYNYTRKKNKRVINTNGG